MAYWRCPHCGSYRVVAETQGMDDQAGLRRLFFLLKILLYLYWLATANRPTGYWVCMRCGFRWRP